MAEKKGIGHAYNIDFLNVVFAASSIFLFVSTIWMVWDDYDREWKNTQRQFAELEYQVTQASMQEAAGGVDQTKLAELQAALQAARQNQAANQDKIGALEAQIADLDARLYREQQAYQFSKATYDQDRYAFEAARAAGASSAERLAQEVEELDTRTQELLLTWEASQAERAALSRQLEEFTGEAAKIERQISEMQFEVTRLQNRLDVLAPSPVKDYFRDAPLLDFMAPTLRVQQTILPNIVDDVNFTRVPKMDRCRTCHLAVDRPGYEEYPQPFTTHPSLEVYLGSASPHPLNAIGCTVCHEGQGQSVSFRDTYHTPETEEQAHEWEERYGWSEEQAHFWDYPMLPTSLTEASCAKCHTQERYLPEAENLNAAYSTYERAGCYACHVTRGFENLRKPGPILTKIDSKLTPEWVETWLRNPRAVKATTWMPKVWYNSNSSTPEDAVRNEVEIDAVVAYLFANTDPYQVPVGSPPQGNAQRGEEIVRSIGCLGCHVLDETDRTEVGPRRTFGQPLQAVGSKTSLAWLYNWIRDPNHYSPGTYMPDLRLTDAQVADVATYLSGLQGSGGDQPQATYDQAAVDAVLLDYLRSVMPTAEAQAQVARLDERAKQLELGRRAISRYGCFSCHDIKGFENTQPIGTDLSEAGSKLVSRLDFAFVDVPHTKLDWYETKLHDPRIFDQGRVLLPLEKLRMPDFGFSDEEVHRLLTAIMSYQREIQPQQAKPVKSARRDFLVQGRAMVQRRNCVGCHVIEGAGGDYTRLVREPSLGPPLLTPTGARVQHDWLYAFLREPITIRPWLSVRMPSFNLDDANWNGIIQYFGAVSDELRPFQTHQIVQTAAPQGVGRELFELLRCQQCHVLGAIPADQETSNLAPDLRMAYERLQPDWIADWMRDPAAIVPGTRMPAFWPDHPKSFYPQLGGDAEAQILAIRDYLLTLRGGPSPRPAGSRAAN
jgi:mono/diheme cytochrome c family protein